MNPVHVLAVLAGAVVVGFVLGAIAEWRLLRPWITLALRQAAILHGPDLPHDRRGLVRTSFQAGDGDEAARARIGGRR
ncbi:hypothetical protein [Glycomyces paridis]|uniref:Uncharacterized protein n=1 Tax=Glycomyces paridis TaxID=2126555 RepID=A0A4S8P6S3_9ACTN|nr:hypothetical protein [Glycomyces paridis]THV25970.1 hypothetical protein E9998_19750 [Glycomyces paridis]